MSAFRSSCGIAEAAHKRGEASRSDTPDLLGTVPPTFPIAMIRLTNVHRAALGAALVLGGAASAQPADRARPDVSARIDRATSGLDLSADQRSRLGDLADDYADPGAGDLWRLSADVAAVLTDAQIDQLREAQIARRSDRREARPERGRRGDRSRRPRGRRRGARRGDEAVAEGRRGVHRMSGEQREAVRAIVQDVRPQAEALVERFRAGDLSDEAFLSEVRELREAAAARLGAALPTEAADRMAQATARHEEATAAREEALGLTAAQKDAYQARALDRLHEGRRRPDMRPYLDAEGHLDRQAFREAMRAQREAARSEREARREQAAQILTDEQQDIVAVHRALAGRHGMRGRRGGMGRMLGPLDRLD